LNEEEKTALLHIPAILVVWWRTACHIGQFTNRMGVWVRKWRHTASHSDCSS